MPEQITVIMSDAAAFARSICEKCSGQNFEDHGVHVRLDAPAPIPQHKFRWDIGNVWCSLLIGETEIAAHWGAGLDIDWKIYFCINAIDRDDLIAEIASAFLRTIAGDEYA